MRRRPGCRRGGSRGVSRTSECGAVRWFRGVRGGIGARPTKERTPDGPFLRSAVRVRERRSAAFYFFPPVSLFILFLSSPLRFVASEIEPRTRNPLGAKFGAADRENGPSWWPSFSLPSPTAVKTPERERVCVCGREKHDKID